MKENVLYIEIVNTKRQEDVNTKIQNTKYKNTKYKNTKTQEDETNMGHNRCVAGKEQ